MSAVRHLRAAERVPTPWKNGAGVTDQIASFPEGSTLDDFGWRISIADVRSDGPFSTFPGVDRQIAILKGSLSLAVGNRDAVHLSQDSQPFNFPGDVPSSARLSSPAVTDLNVMTRRGQFTSRIVRAPIRGKLSKSLAPAVQVAVALDRVDVALGKPYELRRFDALIWTRESEQHLPCPDWPMDDPRLILIQIFGLSPAGPI